MQEAEEDLLHVLNRWVCIGVPAGMDARILCSCRSRLFEASRTRRRSAVRLAACCTLANIVLGALAFQARQRFVRLKDSEWGPGEQE